MRVIVWLVSILLAGAMFASAAGTAATAQKDDPSTHWANISAPRQQVLAPLAAEWDSYPPKARTHFIALADTYPKLKPEQRARIDARLKHWASMSQEERKLARSNYRKVQQLPPEKRAVVKEQLKQAHAKKQAAKTGANAAPTAIAAPNTAAVQPSTSSTAAQTPAPATAPTKPAP